MNPRKTDGNGHIMFMMKVNVAIVSEIPCSPRSGALGGAQSRTIGKEYTFSACRKPMDPIRHAPSIGALSSRERQIVSLVRQAKANKEIAYELCLTEGTVKEYLYRIFRKLNVTSRTELAVRSYRETLTVDALAANDLPQSVGNGVGER